MRSFSRWHILCAGMLFAGVSCFSQGSSTAFSGSVYDSSGAVVVGANVTALNDATGVPLKQVTNSAGLYSFPSVGVGTYTLTIEMSGFKTVRRTGITLVVGTPAVENITLELGDTREVVKVEASAAPVNTATATLGNVVEHQAVASLPLNGRNPLNLIVLEPGVQQNSGTTLTVNGTRSMAGNVTIDGIEANEASNPVPTNNVFRINPDNVEEFKVTTSNPTPEEGKNSGLNVSIATRSGTNEYHVSAIEYFRNRVLNSNEFYANAQGSPRATINSNQYGFDAGGPIKKNKTFAYGAWQGQKVNLALAIDKAFGSIPTVYTPQALSGVYRYFVPNAASPLVINGQKITQNSPALVNADGSLAAGVRNCASSTDLNCIQSYNMYTNDPLHIGGDPGALKLLHSYPGPNNFTSGDGLNTAGFLWNTPYEVRGPRNLVRVDHIINTSNSIYFRALWAEEDQLKGDPLNSRPAIFPGFPPRGEVYRPAQNYAFSWRTVLNPSMVNELTVGYARFKFYFTYIDSNPDAASLPEYTFNNATVAYVNQPHTIRWLNTPQAIDNFSWTRGAHQLKFGVNARFYQQNNQGGTAASQSLVPAISLSASLNPPGTGFNLPAVGAGGITSTDNTRLLSSINDLLGIPANLKSAFLGNLNTDTFVATRSGNYYSLWDTGERLRQYNFYGQDEWRARKNLTVTYGVRWEINRPPTESSEPVFVPNKAIDGSQGPVTFVKADSWWQRSNLGAFAPRIGISWSPFRDNKTVIHAGYGISFDPITTYMAAAAANSLPGLAYTCTAPTYAPSTPGCASVPNVRLSQGFPNTIPPPTGVKPSSFLSPPAQLLGAAPNTVVLDPNMKQATVHQWNVSIQRQLPYDMVLQVAYVANRGERLYSQLDANQISAAPILPQFLSMQSNIGKGCKPDGTGCPSGVTGQSIPLVTSGILTSTFVNSSTTITDLNQNAAGNFAGRIEQTTLAAHLRPNQQFGSIMFLSNSADSVYHSMQTTLRKRFGNGLLFNFAYTYSKVIDDQSGDPIVTTFTPTSVATIDSTNLRNERARADFDQRHVVILTWIYELPFGKGQKWMSNAPKAVNGILGGWSLQGFNSNASGQPFSITSGSKTAFYSTSTNSRAVIVGNTLPSDSLQPKPGVIGPVFFQDPSAFALAAPGSPGMGRNMFNGPWYWDMDGAISKTFSATERVKITFRMEAFNALNHANFRKLSNATVGSNSILSANFGLAGNQSLATSTSTAIVSNGEAYRVAQAVLKVAF
ncbi:MAG TPA: TonB-dependent receptor [Bryobacteraceae bacterium]|nr:TonB-dependent receptor [Bryobacteraceae bacterium]